MKIIWIIIVILFCGSCKENIDIDGINFPVRKVGSYIISPWKYVVIHNSGTMVGNARSFHRYHLGKGWGGLAYHFVISNGKGDTNGKNTAGFRWLKQRYGMHVKTSQMKYNKHGIGICLVGNFNKTLPTKKQLYSLTYVIVKIMKIYKIPSKNILGHKEVPYDDSIKRRASTSCPGKRISINNYRKICKTLNEKLIDINFSKKEFNILYQRYVKM